MPYITNLVKTTSFVTGGIFLKKSDICLVGGGLCFFVLLWEMEEFGTLGLRTPISLLELLCGNCTSLETNDLSF